MHALPKSFSAWTTVQAMMMSVEVKNRHCREGMGAAGLPSLLPSLSFWVSCVPDTSSSSAPSPEGGSDRLHPDSTAVLEDGYVNGLVFRVTILMHI